MTAAPDPSARPGQHHPGDPLANAADLQLRLLGDRFEACPAEFAIRTTPPRLFLPDLLEVARCL